MKTTKVINALLLAASLVILIYAVSVYFGKNIFEETWSYFYPCARPISYHVGTMDSSFGMSEKEFKNIIIKVEEKWEEPVQKNLFEYDERGSLKINLEYDYRQEATDRLKKLGVTIENREEAYAELKAEYESTSAENDRRKTELDQLAANYKQRVNSYEIEVARWNRKGGATPREFERLNNEKDELSMDWEIIEQKQKEFNEEVNALNAIAYALNSLAKELNLDVGTYNTLNYEMHKSSS